MNVSTQAETEFALSPLCSVWSLGRLDDVHSYWEGSSALLRPPIQMLISPGNTLTDIPRSNVLLAIWASLSPVKLTHKSNHHSELSSGWELKRGRQRVRQRELYFFKCILNIYLYLFYLDVLGLSCDMLGLFPDQGSDPGPLYWELRLSYWTTREVPKVLFSFNDILWSLLSSYDWMNLNPKFFLCWRQFEFDHKSLATKWHILNVVMKPVVKL